ncbi:MAG: YdcF family protein [Hyphomicrobiales bacterium]|nr:YdcF family protein [Hyphomicrobiales bacterium]
MSIVKDMNSSADIPVQDRKAKRRWPWLRLMLGGCVVLAAAIIAGFFLYFNLIDDRPAANLDDADAIVVLTGGPLRISEAVKLLMQGKGERLLISGVYSATTRSELVALSPGDDELFQCCVDIGYDARDTIGNADETSSWAGEYGFKSIIVVTDSFHMPRSLAEIRRALPKAQLIPFPVRQDSLHLEAPWSYPGTLKLLAHEYAKFVPAFARCVAVQITRSRSIRDSALDCMNSHPQ